MTPDGVRLYFETLGHGPETIIVPNGTYLRDDLAPLAMSGRRLVMCDPRNRGRSDTVEGGDIVQDADDVEAVAECVGVRRVDLIGHSFAGLVAVLVALRHPERVRRLVLIGPIGMNPDREFPPTLMNRDATFGRIMAELGALLPRRGSYSVDEFCEKVWSILAALYVTDRANAHRIQWGRCSLPNERNAMRYFNDVTLPSIRKLALTPASVTAVTCPALVVHGTRDRSAPYGAGREWALALRDARLISVEGAGHAPWVEAPGVVMIAIETFLRGEWPDGVEQVVKLLPDAGPPVM